MMSFFVPLIVNIILVGGAIFFKRLERPSLLMVGNLVIGVAWFASIIGWVVWGLLVAVGV